MTCLATLNIFSGRMEAINYLHYYISMQGRWFSQSIQFNYNLHTLGYIKVKYWEIWIIFLKSIWVTLDLGRHICDPYCGWVTIAT